MSKRPSECQDAEIVAHKLSKLDAETLYPTIWRKWRFPAVAHCKAGC